jgi:hypothetical protein
VPDFLAAEAIQGCEVPDPPERTWDPDAAIRPCSPLWQTEARK